MEKIAVAGIGKMGLCLALNLEQAGYAVLGLDIRKDHIDAINQRRLYTPEPGVAEALDNTKHFHATSELPVLKEFDPDLIFICIATPNASAGYDHSAIDGFLQSLYALGRAHKRTELVITCTTLPGYCDTKAVEGMQYNYFISYNPEFIAQGSIMHDQVYPDQVLIGEADVESGEKIRSVYVRMCRNQPGFYHMSRLSAEVAKLATNCFLTMKISFANAIGDLALHCGAEPEKILAAIGGDTRIGKRYLNHGYGFGGPCFPRDNRALAYFADCNNFELPLAKATDLVNAQHLDFQFRWYLSRYGQDEAITFTSVTYKPGTLILEESQQLALALKLAHAGRTVVIEESAEVIDMVKKLYGDTFLYRLQSI